MRDLRLFVSKTLISLFIIFISASCVEKSFNPEDPADVFAAAVEPYNDGLYDIALQKLGQFKSRFPYSQFSAKADLYIANAHFKLGRYQEAAISYGQFIKLHPGNSEIDYARFRIGECFWVEAPEEIDREQDFTSRAIAEWQTLIRLHPQSKYVTKAKEHIAAGEKRIARNHEFVMNFYCKQEKYHACAFKAVRILEDFSIFPEIRRVALEKATLAFDKLAQQKQSNPEDDSNIYVKSMTYEQLKAKAQTFRQALKSLSNKAGQSSVKL